MEVAQGKEDTLQFRIFIFKVVLWEEGPSSLHIWS